MYNLFLLNCLGVGVAASTLLSILKRYDLNSPKLSIFLRNFFTFFMGTLLGYIIKDDVGEALMCGLLSNLVCSGFYHQIGMYFKPKVDSSVEKKDFGGVSVVASPTERTLQSL